MTILKITVVIKPQKRTEFLQAMHSLVLAAPPESGCLERAVYQRIDDENAFCCLELWESEEKMATHLDTDHFKALLGAVKVLGEMNELSRSVLFPLNPHPPRLIEQQNPEPATEKLSRRVLLLP